MATDRRIDQHAAGSFRCMSQMGLAVVAVPVGCSCSTLLAGRLLLKAEMHRAAHKQPYIQAALELTSMCMSHHNLLKAAVTIDCN